MNKSITYQIDDSLFNIFSCDNLENILKEYQLTNYYYLDQIHSNIIHIVDNNYQNNSQGDGLITSKPNIPLVIRTADCIPILIYDKQHKVLGLIHSGWLGTLNNIIVDAINLIINNYHSKKENIYIYIYPSIHKCHFEVDEDVYQKFTSKYKFTNQFTTKKNNKYYIDLQGIVKYNLEYIGITNIIESDICTYCHHDSFHSYRYNHTDKRNYLIAYIKE